MGVQVGISREGLSMKNLQDFLIPIPPLEEQNRIVARVDQLMSLCDKLEAGLMRSQADSERLMEAVVGGCWRDRRESMIIFHLQQTALSIMNEIIYLSELNGH